MESDNIRTGTLEQLRESMDLGARMGKFPCYTLDEEPLHEIASLWLEEGGSPDVRIRGYTFLHLAAQQADPQTVELMLAKGANPDLGTPEGEFPLLFADAMNRKEGAPVDYWDETEQSILLHFSADKMADFKRDAARVLELLEKACAFDGRRYFDAILKGDLAFVEDWIIKGLPVLMHHPLWGDSLSLALSRGHAAIVERILSQGVSARPKEAWGALGARVPLLAAIKSGNLELVEWVLKHGAHLSEDLAQAGRYEVEKAFPQDDEAIRAYVLQHASGLSRTTSTGETLGWRLCRSLLPGQVEQFRERLAPLMNVPDSCGLTFLHRALQERRLELALELLHAGADPTIPWQIECIKEAYPRERGSLRELTGYPGLAMPPLAQLFVCARHPLFNSAKWLLPVAEAMLAAGADPRQPIQRSCIQAPEKRVLSAITLGNDLERLSGKTALELARELEREDIVMRLEKGSTAD